MQVTSREHVQTSAFPPEAHGRVPLCRAMTRQGFLFSGWMPMETVVSQAHRCSDLVTAFSLVLDFEAGLCNPD